MLGRMSSTCDMLEGMYGRVVCRPDGANGCLVHVGAHVEYM